MHAISHCLGCTQGVIGQDMLLRRVLRSGLSEGHCSKVLRRVLARSLVSLSLRCPRPQTGPRIPISWKRGFQGPKTPPFPLALEKGSFLSKIPLFFLDPGILFSRIRGLSGVGGIPTLSVKHYLGERHLSVSHVLYHPILDGGHPRIIFALSFLRHLFLHGSRVKT